METPDVIYRSASLVLRDVHCARYHERRASEECADGHNVVLVRSGAFTKTTGRETVVANPNHVLFFNRHEPYHVTHPIAGGDVCTSITLRSSDLLDVIRAHAPADAEREDAPFAFTWALSTSRTFLLHHTLLAGLRHGHIARLAVEDLVFDLIHDLIGGGYELFQRRRHRARQERRRRDLVEAAKLVIERQLENPPALDRMAEDLGCSAFHLSRVFHQEAGLPMRRYLDRCRLRTAAERLADGEKNLTGLALDLGYADHSHFSNAFRREFGVSPSQFRVGAGRAAARAPHKNLQA